MTYDEIAIRFRVKYEVVRSLMKKFRKKPGYFIEEIEKISKRHEEEQVTFAVV